MSTARQDFADAFHDAFREFPQRMRELKEGMKHAFDVLKDGMAASYKFSGDVFLAGYHEGAKHTVKGYNNDRDIRTLNTIAASFSGLAGIIVLSPLVATGFATSVSIAPMLMNSRKSFLPTLKKIINLSRYDILKHEIRDKTYASDGLVKKRHIVYASPGYVAAGFVGFPVLVFSALLRVLSNTLKAFGQTWLWGIRLALQSKSDFMLGPDISNFIQDKSEFTTYTTTEKIWRLGVGSVGVILGFIAGIISAGIVFAMQGLKKFLIESAISFISALKSLVNPFLPAKEPKNAEEVKDNKKADPRKGCNIFLGGLGYATGLAVGLVADIFITLSRIASNTLKAFGQTWLWAVRLALDLPKESTFLKNIKSIQEESEKNTPAARKNYLWRFFGGFAGVLTGLVVGGISAAIVLVCRGVIHFLKESAKSFISALKLAVNPFLPAIEAKRAEVVKDGKKADPRKGCNIFLGGLGYATGLAVGLATDIIITLSRIASNTLKAFGQTWLWAVRLALPKEISFLKNIQSIQQESEKNTPAARKNYLWRFFGGFAGVLTGLVVGGISAAIILACRGVTALIKHSITSFMALSRSYLNVATGRCLFNGVGADERTNKQKRIGGFGYLLATVTTGVISAMIFVTRKSIPILGTILISLLSPLVFTFKVLFGLPLSACGVNNRFKANENEECTPSIQRVKNLYSSLSAAGRLPGENQQGLCTEGIVENGTGRVTLKQFLGKCIKLNLSSSTERYLKLVLSKLRKNPQGHRLDYVAEDFIRQYASKSDSIFDAEGTSIDTRNNIKRMTMTVNHYIRTGNYILDAKQESFAFTHSFLFFVRKIEDEPVVVAPAPALSLNNG